jgi:hypothetical protein
VGFQEVRRENLGLVRTLQSAPRMIFSPQAPALFDDPRLADIVSINLENEAELERTHTLLRMTRNG